MVLGRPVCAGRVWLPMRTNATGPTRFRAAQPEGDRGAFAPWRTVRNQGGHRALHQADWGSSEVNIFRGRFAAASPLAALPSGNRSPHRSSGRDRHLSTVPPPSRGRFTSAGLRPSPAATERTEDIGCVLVVSVLSVYSVLSVAWAGISGTSGARRKVLPATRDVAAVPSPSWACRR